MNHVIVLAGGEGRRLEPQARARYGYARPKQYCDFGDGVTLLDRTLARARRLVTPDRIVVVTTAGHREEADECLARWPGVRRLEQPRNRDTLPGLALPILSILDRDPSARVVVLPSDHSIADEHGFTQCLARIVATLSDYPFDLLLLGAQVETPEDGYGWILPSHCAGRWPGVAGFREKPPAEELPHLISRGALANTFVMAGDAWSFAQVILRHAPTWFSSILSALHDSERLRQVYDALPSVNFSEGLHADRADLRVVPMPAVGWSDVGTPERLQRSMRSYVEQAEVA